jgi:hypothetical protein
MRLVIRYDIGDDCTWWAQETLPVEYESAEKFLVDFEEAVWAAHKEADRSWYYQEFTVAGLKFNICHFIVNGEFQPPAILTVDEWFAGK